MLGLGWTEMMVIGLVALVVIGPKDLPVVMGRIGKIFGQIRRMGNEFQREINRTTGLDEVRNLRNSITSPLKKTADEIRRDFNTMTPTGPKPSGAIKPADPKAESVVDELRSAAGMPAAPKSNDELAADYGFKAGQGASEPVKAAPVKAPKPAKPAPTAPVMTTDLAPIPEAPAAKPAVAKKPAAVKKPAAAKAAPVKKAPATKASAVSEADAVAKPVRKPRAKPAVAEVTAPSVEAAKPVAPAKTLRAPRKKPAEPAETK
jgi:sec-independent protein translocase protein TatB